MVAEPEHVVDRKWPEAELIAVEAAVRRVIAARVHNRHDVGELVQEALARLERVRHRLAPEALARYASVVARNLAHSHARAAFRAERHAHLVVEQPEPESAVRVVERAEEAAAMRVAIGRLTVEDRELLLSREVDGMSPARLAAVRGGTSGGVRVQLARIRAHLRLEFLLAFRRVGDLPTGRCRPVLLAISGADQRRQRALSANAHLIVCRACDGLASALRTRRRASA